jgi:hypothetical protein
MIRTYGIAIAIVLFGSAIAKAEPQTTKRQVLYRLDDATILVGAKKDSGRAFTCTFLLYADMANPDDMGVECVELKMTKPGHYVIRANVSLQVEGVDEQSVKAKLCTDGKACQSLWGQTRHPMRRSLRQYVKDFSGYAFLSPTMREMVQLANPGDSFPINNP